MFVLKEMNSYLQLGLHQFATDLFQSQFQMLAWLQTQQTRVLMLTAYIMPDHEQRQGKWSFREKLTYLRKRYF